MDTTSQQKSMTEGKLGVAKEAALGWIKETFGSGSELTDFNSKIAESSNIDRIKTVIDQVLAIKNRIVGIGDRRDVYEKKAFAAINLAINASGGASQSSGAGGTSFTTRGASGNIGNTTTTASTATGSSPSNPAVLNKNSDAQQARFITNEQQDGDFADTVKKSHVDVAQGGSITQQIMNLAPGKISAAQAYDIYKKNKGLIAKEMGDQVYTMANGDLGLTNPGKQGLGFTLTNQLKHDVKSTTDTAAQKAAADAVANIDGGPNTTLGVIGASNNTNVQDTARQKTQHHQLIQEMLK